MIHYTLNTGDSVIQSPADVGEHAVALLGPLVKSNGGSLPHPFAAFRVTITTGHGASIFTVWRGREPLVTCGLAWTTEGASEVWPELEAMYLGLSDRTPHLMAPGKAPQMPGTLPWLAVVVLPFILNQRQEDVGWLADFERCLAVAIMQS